MADSRLNELLDHERRSMGADIELIDHTVLQEDVLVIVYAHESQPTENLGRLRSIRYAIDANGVASGVVRSEWIRES